MDGLEEGESFWTRMGRDPVPTILNMTWDDIWGVTDDFNRNINPVGAVAHNGYTMATGKDMLTQQPSSRIDAFGNLVILGIFHQSGKYIPSSTTQLEKQMAENSVATT